MLCTGVLMMVLDTTVVTVALPSIQADLGFSGSSLVWVLNAYMLTFGGFLLLGGRLGDLFGQRKLFLLGLAVFTVASLACGLAYSQALLVVARGVQGVAGAVVSAVALALIMNLFTEEKERVQAMGIYGFVMAAGGSLGEVLGGVMTKFLGWESVFLINLPIGVGVYWACTKLLPVDAVANGPRKLDIGGAVTVTLGLLLAVYAVIDANNAGWTSPQTLTLLGVAALLIAAFLVIESRVERPLMPLRLFALRNVAVANVVGVLWAAGMFAWFVISALYMQHVLGYDPLQVGLAFLPADVIMAAFSVGLSAKMVMRYGLRGPLWLGLAIAAVGLLWLARAPIAANFWIDILPSMLLLGLGAGMAFNPALLAAMNDVHPSESGLASGVVNTSFMMGGALGLAVLAAAAEARSASLAAAGAETVVSLYGGYQLAFLLGAIITALAALIGGLLLKPKASPPDVAAAAVH
ncbi:MAG TPA: DHA2 family efflux MFS transporter permease subunit [Verrucomicrobiae bacterium]|nr:DHA2 family efflux MFS transporter permease subunit [Verrucomicrobiae bacterium]